MPLLGMGRDVPDGVMHLSEGRLEVDWTTETSLDYFERRARDHARRSPASSAATYADNPLWWAKRVITVHPLGGAPMGRHAGEGVCDEYGEVFGFPGLYVLDGSLLPGPVGANPSLTIAAVADRGCTHILERRPPRARCRWSRRSRSNRARDPVTAEPPPTSGCGIRRSPSR